MVLIGLIVDHEHLRQLTRDFLELRQRFYRSSLAPGKPPLDVLRTSAARIWQDEPR